VKDDQLGTGGPSFAMLGLEQSVCPFRSRPRGIRLARRERGARRGEEQLGQRCSRAAVFDLGAGVVGLLQRFSG
jgi:hypothetical protein